MCVSTCGRKIIFVYTKQGVSYKMLEIANLILCKSFNEKTKIQTIKM